MEKKIALITGSTKGIGKACASKLLRENYTVIINYSNDRGTAEKTFLELSKIGTCDIIQSDMSTTEGISAVFDKIAEIYGRLDLLVNNVGIVRDNSIFNLLEENIDATLNLNVKSTLLCIREAAKIMFTQKSGNIINISSVSSILANPGQITYSGSKGAINSMTITAAKELAPFGIRVNAVAPGFIKTDMVNTRNSAQERFIKNIPLGAIGEPEDVANLVSFLASDNSKYITGQVITIDGGLSI